MHQTPPCGPNSGNSGDKARERIEALHRLTQDILAKSTTPHLPELSQLILERGRLVDEIRLLNLQNCPQDEQAALLQILLQCRELDQTIAQNMTTFQSDLAEQMRGLKEAKALLSKYQTPGQGEQGTRSRNA